MQRKLYLVPALIALGLAAAPNPGSAAPLGSAALAATEANGLVHKVWHTGTPHRRVIGDRVYGGDCPQQGCSLRSQRDITPDPQTGKYRWKYAPPSAGYGAGTYAAPPPYEYEYRR